MVRSRVSRRLDRRIYSRTASRTRAINLRNRIYRGGIRL